MQRTIACPTETSFHTKDDDINVAKTQNNQNNDHKKIESDKKGEVKVIIKKKYKISKNGLRAKKSTNE